MKTFIITNPDFSKVLRIFAGSGSVLNGNTKQIGNCFLISTDAITFFLSNFGESEFFLEYIWSNQEARLYYGGQKDLFKMFPELEPYKV